MSRRDVAAAILHKKGIKPKSLDIDILSDNTAWEDVTCPICLDFPHNGVLLRCSSFDKGCRPYICDTDQTRSNCLDRFRSAHGLPAAAKVSSATNGASLENVYIIPSNPTSRPSCPLCRGDVLGWVVVDEARSHLNLKRRCCEDNQCSYVGNYFELQKHTQLKHPNSCPSEIDPVRRLDWENFQQSSDIIDVLTTIHAQVPNSIVLGDYVIEYGDDDGGDDYELFRGARRSWWPCCIFCKAFSRSSRNRRRSRVRERRARGSNRRRLSSDDVNYEGPRRSVDLREIRFDEIADEYIGTNTPVALRRNASHFSRDVHGRR